MVASLPASDIEIGGEGGEEALDAPQEHLRPRGVLLAAGQRRGGLRDRAPPALPRRHREAPSPRRRRQGASPSCTATQQRRLPLRLRRGATTSGGSTAAYPIHPELFDRLYSDWSSLDRFQRTRGVLRLMAASSTPSGSAGQNLLIMPATVPMENGVVQFELTRYLDDPWDAVIEKDVDGPNSLPLRLDRENPNLGRYSACRRVARTIYLGSAPTAGGQPRHRGEERPARLRPARRDAATFGDALRRLTDGATYLYVDGKRYWYSTQPSVTRLAQDRAESCDPDDVQAEIVRRLRAEAGQEPAASSPASTPRPTSSADVPTRRRPAW